MGHPDLFQIGQSVGVERQKIDWATGVCVDGPLEGKELYCENRVGCSVTFAAGVEAEGIVYRVSELAVEGRQARLVHVTDEEPPS